MDPFTIAFIASQGLKVAGALQMGGLAKEQAALKREIAELNARAAERDAFEAVRIGLGKKANYMACAEDVVQKQNVIFAYADVDTSFGTARQLQEETRLIGRLNAADISNAAYAQALGYKRQALNYRLNSQLQSSAVEAQSAQNLTASVIQAGANIGMNFDKLSFGGGAGEPAGLNIDSTLSYGNFDGPSDNLGLDLSVPQLGF